MSTSVDFAPDFKGLNFPFHGVHWKCKTPMYSQNIHAYCRGNAVMSSVGVLTDGAHFECLWACTKQTPSPCVLMRGGANTKVLCFVVYLSKKNKYKQCHVRMWWPDLTRVIDCITYLNSILWFCDPAGTIRYNRVNKSLQYKRNQGVLSVSLNELSMEIVSHQRFSSLTSVAKLVAKLS